MADITLRKVFKVAGVATDVTSFTLGVTRTDTNGVVVASGTAMTRVSTGTYEYSLTPPASGLTYSITYVAVYQSQTFTFTDTYVDTGEDEIPLPALTGDATYDTLQSLQIERLRVARAGPKVTYSLHNHRVDWNAYMKELDARILALRVELAQRDLVEFVGFVE